MPHKPGYGAIFGIVSEDGIVKENSPVLLIDPRRDADGNQRIIGRQLTDNSGGFRFTGLDPAYADYMLLATDEDGAEPKNALVQDRVQPVDARSGTGWESTWWYYALRDGALAGWSGLYDPGNNKPIALQAGNQFDDATIREQAFVPPAYGVTFTPGAPQIPSMRLNGEARLFSIWNNAEPEISGTLPHTVSLEMMLDFGNMHSTDTFEILTVLRNDDSGFDPNQHGVQQPDLYSVGSCPLGLRINPVTKLIQVLVMRGDGNYMPRWQYSSRTLLESQDMSDLKSAIEYDAAGLSGQHHVVVTAEWSGMFTLYIDGVSVATFDSDGILPAVTDGLDTYTPHFVGVSFSQLTTSNEYFHSISVTEGPDVVVGPFAAYWGILTAQQVADHYAALSGVLESPPVTGFPKAVMSHQPLCYYRLNEGDLEPASGGSENLMGLQFEDKRIVNRSGTALTPLQSAPIAGSGGVKFVSGYMENVQPHHAAWPYGYRQATMLFLVKFEGVAAGRQTIIYLVGRSNSTQYHHVMDVHRTVDDELGFSLMLASKTPETGVFSTAPLTVDKWYLAAISIDKAQSEARLYLGDFDADTAVLAETKIISSTGFPPHGWGYRVSSTDAGPNTLTRTYPNWDDSKFWLGGGDPAVTLSIYPWTPTAFYGQLSEVAILPTAIDLADFEYLWSQKDVV